MVKPAVVFMIPTERLEKNAAVMADVLLAENTYPSVGGQKSQTLDNWTASLMVLAAGYRNEETGIMDNVENVYIRGNWDQNPADILLRYYKGHEEMGTFPYGRYWHGYLVFLKPILSFVDYAGWRGINQMFQIALMVVLIGLMLWRKQYASVIPVGFTLLLLRPVAIRYSLQYSTIFDIILLSGIAILLFYKKLKARKWGAYLFCLIGMSTSFFDLLTYPVAALGLPLLFWLMQSDFAENWINKLKEVVGYSASWCLGYIGLWLMKWIVSDVVFHGNVIQSAVDAVKTRASSSVSGQTVGKLETIQRNMSLCFSESYQWIFVVLLGILVVVVMSCFWKNVKQNWRQMIPYLCIALYPFVWYFGATNHAYIHTFFEYRNLSVFALALLLMMT